MSDPITVTNAGKALAAVLRQNSGSVPIRGDGYDGTNGWSEADFAKYQEAVFGQMAETILDFMRKNLVIFGYAPLPPYSSAPTAARVNIPATVSPVQGGNTGTSFIQDLGV